MSNFVFGSNTLKYDDVIGIILSEKIHRKTLGGSTSRSSLNAQTEVEQLREEVIPKIVGNQEESQRGRGPNLEDREIASTMEN